MKNQIGFWGYPQTFYTTANGYPLVGVKVFDERDSAPIIMGDIPDREPDYSTGDHYSVTKIWVDKTQAPQAGEMSTGRKVHRLWRGAKD